MEICTGYTMNEQDIIDGTNACFDYMDHLCKVFFELSEFKTSNRFVKLQKERKCRDFFLNNLFLFYRYINNTDLLPQDITKLKESYDSFTGSLYHYTTYESLEKIIKGKSLKLNNLISMNDSKEGTALLNFLKKQDLTEEFKLTLKEVPQYIPRIFSFSFTALNDDAAQWERYAIPKNKSTNTSCGVCIEFSRERLLNRISSISGLSLKEITPVLYVSDYNKDNILLQILFRFMLANQKDNNLNQLDEENREQIAKQISFYSADIKHYSFENERELRLIISLEETNKDITFPSMLLSLIQDGNDDLSDLIKSIKIGPGAQSYKTRIEELLNKYGCSQTSITESECTLQ